MAIDWSKWVNAGQLSPRVYSCGYCGSNSSISHTGYYHKTDTRAHIYICGCGMPTFFFAGKQYPGPILGRNIKALPEDVEKIYKEIRGSIKDSLYTGALLLGRKLIMHLAVDIAGADEGKTFVAYIEHLEKSGYIPPTGDKVLTYMKDRGNEKNHQITIGTKEEAEKMLKFVEVLLIFMYETPAAFPDTASEEQPAPEN